MRRLTALLPLLLLLAAALPAAAQPTRTLTDDAWCHDDGNTYGDEARYCEVREVTLPAGRAVVAVDSRKNGGIQVRGWDRNEILVRARVTARARTQGTARQLADDVTLHTDRTITADVPKGKNHQWASVSFEVFVPHRSNLELDAHNGGIDIEAVHGDITFDALNGGVSLHGLGGDVTGTTTNGGLHVTLTGSRWEGKGLDVRTTNGGIDLVVPAGYSAHLETGTVNGHVEVDFPVVVQGRITRTLSTDLGNGGPTVRVVTTNGGVDIRKS